MREYHWPGKSYSGAREENGLQSLDPDGKPLACRFQPLFEGFRRTEK
jgi:hypothetical protein